MAQAFFKCLYATFVTEISCQLKKKSSVVVKCMSSIAWDVINDFSFPTYKVKAIIAPFSQGFCEI